VRIGHIGDVHVFVTDRLESPDLAAKCKAQGVRVIETARDPAG
jgi:DeoR family glycerol-3-phosphate regulon repressor